MPPILAFVDLFVEPSCREDVTQALSRLPFNESLGVVCNSKKVLLLCRNDYDSDYLAGCIVYEAE